jgi:amidophosphoribosyltransferase
MATHGELIAARMSVEDIRRTIDADSLGYLSLDGLFKSIANKQESYCAGCFTKRYPMDVQLAMDKLSLERV